MEESKIITHEKIKISINIPSKLLLDLDNHRSITKQDRSTWISAAILEKLAKVKKEMTEEKN